MTASPRRLFSLDETDRLISDHDYPSTVDNLATYGVSATAQCFSLLALPVSEIDTFQLIDDPDDADGWRKVESVRSAIREGRQLPPVYVLHAPGNKYPYYLFEGRHRYNAAHAEEALELLAWVGHVDCCERSQAPTQPDEEGSS